MREWSIKCSRNTSGVERLTNHTLLSGLSQHCSCSSVLQGADPLPYMQTTRSEALYSWTVHVAQHWTYRPITHSVIITIGSLVNRHRWRRSWRFFTLSSQALAELNAWFSWCSVTSVTKKRREKKPQTLILIKRHNQCIPNTVKKENI